MLSYANSFIDTFQGVKTTALNTIVTDTKVRAPLQAFIDAQTTFAKSVAKISNDVYQTVSTEVEKYTLKSK